MTAISRDDLDLVTVDWHCATCARRGVAKYVKAPAADPADAVYVSHRVEELRDEGDPCGRPSLTWKIRPGIRP